MAMTEADVLNIVRKHTSKKVSVSLSSNLVQDLSIDGDDAEELFSDLLQGDTIEFSIDRMSNYFHTEDELLDLFHYPKLILYKLRFRATPPQRELEIFTVKDLVVLLNEQSI
jgi:hypothetical protein